MKRISREHQYVDLRGMWVKGHLRIRTGGQKKQKQELSPVKCRSSDEIRD